MRARSGRNSPSYNHEVVEFTHDDGRTISATQHDMAVMFGGASGSYGSVARGRYASYRGWTSEISRSSGMARRKKVPITIVAESGECVSGTAADVMAATGLSRQAVRKIAAGAISKCGWRLIGTGDDAASRQSNAGRSVMTAKKAGFVGAYRRTESTFKCMARLGGKKLVVGTYSTEEDAALAYDVFLFRNVNGYTPVNFPELFTGGRFVGVEPKAKGKSLI